MIRKKRKSRKAPELFFVIGGGINRTKCASQKDAVAHATRLLQGQSGNGQPMAVGVGVGVGVGVDMGNAGGDYSAVVIVDKAHLTRPSWGGSKIEQAQCVKTKKPLYIVKVVGIAELIPPPVRVRAPKGDELA
jgi:hypothetical protein